MEETFDVTKAVELLSATSRMRVYLIYALVAGLIGATLAGYATVGWAVPDAVNFASAFVNFLGVFFGITAANNVTKTETKTVEVTGTVEDSAVVKQEVIDPSSEGVNYDDIVIEETEGE